MVNIDIARSSPSRAIIRAKPAATGGSAGAALLDIGAIPLEDNFPRIAVARLDDPVREQISAVTRLRALRSNGESGELSARGACSGDIWGSGDRKSEREGEEREEREKVHLCLRSR